MAGIPTKEIKNRIRSMASTRQITKAMETVAASKLRRAQAQAMNARPYFEILCSTIHDIVDHNRDFPSQYLTARPVKKVAWVVIAGDRGLAGGYNGNVLKLAWGGMIGRDAQVLPVGKKAVDYFRSRNTELMTQSYAEAEDVSVSDCFTVAKLLCREYRAGNIDEIHVAYTQFVSALSQTPAAIRLLPLIRQNTGREGAVSQDIVYEPDSVEVFDAVVPEYLGGVLYGALCESRAAEQAARRAAMDSAARNADEMIAQLRLTFNRARQAAITQEITEIVAGS